MAKHKLTSGIFFRFLASSSRRRHFEWDSECMYSRRDQILSHCAGRCIRSSLGEFDVVGPGVTTIAWILGA